MKISNLKEGDIYKNHPDLCKALEIADKQGNSRKSQIKEIRRYADLRKDGRKYIVNEIYDIPSPQESNNNAYGGLIQLLLTDYLMKTEESRISCSANYLLRQVSMINNSYSENKRNIPMYSVEKSLDKDIAFDFYDTTDGVLKKSLKTALRNLENRALLLFNTDFLVKPEDSWIHRLASPKEKDAILFFRDDLLSEFGYNKINKVLFSSDGGKFKRRLNKRLKEEIGLDYAYKGYDIHILQDNIARKQTEMIVAYLSNIQRQSYREELNMIVIERLRNNAENRQKEANKGFGEGKNNKHKARKSEKYLPSVDTMIQDNIKNF